MKSHRGGARSRICTNCPVMPVYMRREKCPFIMLSAHGFVNSCKLGLWTRAKHLKCNYGDIDVLQLEKILKTIEDNTAREILLRYLSRMGREAEMGALQIKA